MVVFIIVVATFYDLHRIDDQMIDGYTRPAYIREGEHFGIKQIPKYHYSFIFHSYCIRRVLFRTARIDEVGTRLQTKSWICTWQGLFLTQDEVREKQA